MSTCIENAELYRGKMVQVVQTKTALCVALFIAYGVYTVCLAAKHCLKASGDENKRKWSERLGKVTHDITGKSCFFFFLLMVCAQVKASVFAAILVYLYLGALGCQFVGALCEDNVALRKLRALGLIGVAVLCGFLYWAILINEWCTYFYFKSTFSLAYKS